jgi:predicted RNase H-like HicB family nuclease
VKVGRWYHGEVLEADGVYTQGRTLQEAIENLAEATALMLEEAPDQFHKTARRAPSRSEKVKFFIPVKRLTASRPAG